MKWLGLYIVVPWLLAVAYFWWSWMKDRKKLTKIELSTFDNLGIIKYFEF